MNHQLSTNLTDPGRVRVLLVPVGPVPRETFRRLCRLIARNDAIRLADIVPDTSTSNPAFSDHRFKGGKLRFHFTTSHSSGENAFLEEFQIHKQVLGVIGISTIAYSPDLQESHVAFTNICERYPTSICHRFFVFEPGTEMPQEVRGITIVPSQGDINFYARTLMEDFAGGLLSSLSIMAAAIERRSVIHTPSPTANAGANTQSTLGVPSPNDSPNSTGGNATPIRSLSPFYRVASPIAGGPPSHSAQSREAVARENRARTRTPGRVQKLLGDLFLVAGKTPEAISAYVSATEATHSTSDYVWCASATEGLCSAVQMLAEANPPDVGPLRALQAYTNDLGLPAPGPSPGSTSASSASSTTTLAQLRAFLRDVPARYREVVNMYERGHAWPILYAEACLKMAREAAALERSRYRVEEVSAWASRGWAYAGASLGVGEQVGVATATAEVFGMAGARRKRAFWLRRVELLVWGVMRREMAEGERIGEGIRRRVLSCLSRICPAYGVEEFVPGRAPFLEMPGPLDNEDDEEEGIQCLGGGPFGWPSLQVDILRECLAVSEALGEYERTIFYGTQLLRKRRRHLHREEQARISGVLQRIVTEAKSMGIIPDSGIPGIWWGESFLRSLEVCRPPPTRTPHIAQSANAAADLAAGDPFIYNPYAPVKTGAEEEGEMMAVQGEPLWIMVTVWNPFFFDLDLEDVQLVVDGPVHIKVDSSSAILSAGSVATLRLCCTVIRLKEVTTPSIQDSEERSSEDATSPEETAAHAPSTEDPMLTIHGITATAFGGIRQEFRVLGDVPTVAIDAERRKLDLSRRAQMKRTGLDGYDEGEASSKRESAELLPSDPKSHPLMRIPVIGALPVLRIKSTSLAHGAMMLFEGERGKMTITLENISRVHVNFLLPSFTETASAAVSAAARQQRDARQTREDAYEADFYAAEVHAFIWRDADTHEGSVAEPAHVSIGPGETYLLTIDVFGKRGCAGGNVHIAYGHSGTAAALFSDHSDDPAESRLMPGADRIKYTRQVSVPVMLTVRRAVELVEIDAFSVKAEQLLEDPELARTLSATGADGTANLNISASYCLLAMDVRNTWSSQIDLVVGLRRKWALPNAEDPEGDDASGSGSGPDLPTTLMELNYSIPASSTKRLLMPVQRMQLGREEAGRVIPTAANKQFIVSKAKPNPEQEEMSRRLFWYKEALLAQLTTSWTCLPSRAGYLDLRSVRLNEPMLEVLSAPEVELVTMLRPVEGASLLGEVQTLASGKYRVQELDMVQLVVRICNRKAHPIKLFLRIQPMLDHGNGKADCHMTEAIAFNGQLQTVLPKIGALAEYEHKLPLCFLAGGRYTFSCHAERTDEETAGEVGCAPGGGGIFQGSPLHVEVMSQ